jgi:hypothetical protein
VQAILDSGGLDPTFGGKGGAMGTAGDFNAPGYIYLAYDERGARAAAANFFGPEVGIAVLEVVLEADTILIKDPDLPSAVRTTRKLTNVRRV